MFAPVPHFLETTHPEHHSRCDLETAPAIPERQIRNSYRAAVARALNCPVNQTRIHGSLKHHHADAAILVVSCPDLDLESPRQCRNLESQEISCKPHFWTAGQIHPPWVPGNLLQLLLGSPSLTGSNSGNSIWPLSCSFSLSATANLVPREDSPEFSRQSKMQLLHAAVSRRQGE
jgi:hypothetical protein